MVFERPTPEIAMGGGAALGWSGAAGRRGIPRIKVADGSGGLVPCAVWK
jgi:hypothetical protein